MNGDFLVIGVAAANLIIGVVYLLQGDWPRAVYWGAAAALNWSTLFIGR